MLPVFGFSSSVFIGLKKFKEERDVYSVIYFEYGDVRLYDVRADKTGEVLKL